jgi:hypothetical protein
MDMPEMDHSSGYHAEKPYPAKGIRRVINYIVFSAIIIFCAGILLAHFGYL